MASTDHIWSQETLDELARHLVTTFNLPADAAKKRIDEMNRAFPEALVSGYQRLIPSMTNHPKDRHVLAAAVRTGSQVVVTSNLKDFPTSALSQFDIEAQPPDLFLLHQANLDPRASAAIIRMQASEKAKPPRTQAEILDRIAKSAPKFATAMRILLGLPDAGTLAPSKDMALMPTEVQAVPGNGEQQAQTESVRSK